MSLTKFVKRGAVMVRQYSRRISIIERHIRGQGLEIGALQDPQVVPRGTRVRYVDIVSNEDAARVHPRKRQKDLVPVDIVDDGQTLATVANESQDFVISNHFLEHCQDPLRALENMLRVVRVGGVVYLSIPDKRRTFDRNRPTTTAEHLIEDYRRGPQSSMRGHYEEAVRCNERITDPDQVATRVDERIERGDQIHFHCWDDRALLATLLAARDELEFPFEIEEFARNEAELVCVLSRQASATDRADSTTAAPVTANC